MLWFQKNYYDNDNNNKNNNNYNNNDNNHKMILMIQFLTKLTTGMIFQLANHLS